MLISYRRPDPITWSIVGTGAAFLTDPNALSNGRPAAGTRIQFVSGTQTIASVTKIRAVWNPFGAVGKVTFAGIIGTTLPVGLRVVCSVSSGFSWDVDPVEGVVVERPDGVRVVWFLFPDDVYPAIGMQFAVYNDAGGFAVLSASDTFDIGELWFGEADQYCIRPTYQSGTEDPSLIRQSIGGQPFPVARRASATSSIEITPITYDDAWPQLAYVRSQLLSYSPAVVVPITSKPFTGTPISMEYVNRHAEFGYAKTIGPIVGEEPRFKMTADFVAPPALLP